MNFVQMGFAERCTQLGIKDKAQVSQLMKTAQEMVSNPQAMQKQASDNKEQLSKGFYQRLAQRGVTEKAHMEGLAKIASMIMEKAANSVEEQRKIQQVSRDMDSSVAPGPGFVDEKQEQRKLQQASKQKDIDNALAQQALMNQLASAGIGAAGGAGLGALAGHQMGINPWLAALGGGALGGGAGYLLNPLG